MNAPITLPAGALYEPTPGRFSTEELADKYINHKMATGLTTEAMRAALDATTLWKGIRAEYDVYAAAQEAVDMRPDGVAELLPPGMWDSLDAKTRKDVRNRINKKADYNRRGLAAVRRFIEVQAGSADTGSALFQQVYQQRLDEYLNEPLS